MTSKGGVPSRGRIAVSELFKHGLTEQPACVNGVCVRSVMAVLCRHHVDASALDLVGAVPTDEAVLLVLGPGCEAALSVWCTVCLAEGGRAGAYRWTRRWRSALAQWSGRRPRRRVPAGSSPGLVASRTSIVAGRRS